MPSTLVAFIITSHSLSMARRAAQLSVVKNGLPVPAEKITTEPAERSLRALRRSKNSQTGSMRMADITTESIPCLSRASCMARPFITVPSMPMASPWARFMPPAEAEMPRTRLPPPITSATCTPCLTMEAISDAMSERIWLSIPWPFSPARASPLSLRRMRLNLDIIISRK